ncbi:hypothetical protein [Phyllobacterium endophyticum]|uniref:hypothetical protein n=1 Tax=Phyllobacterium endophyticum TaxID=1149773 RepID=UPI0011C82126|nr:hypothetical protein [Phyllobacterium endophyticum]TXR49897.1 hypothetical protein FVA77_07745 [Phyllobacterium endophyticum]
MSKAPNLVPGVVQPDHDLLADGVGVAVSDTAPVQGQYSVSTGAKNEFEWEVVSMDGKSHGMIKIITN